MTQRLTCGKCDNGWICEAHRVAARRLRGPGMPCEVPACRFRIDMRPVPTRSGLVCPQCREQVATVARMSSGLLFECPACGNRWSWSETKAH